MTFISIHSIIIYVVFFGACMRCTRLCSLKPGVTRTKHIDIRYHFLRDHQQKGDIEIAYVNTKNQLADIFTKPLDEKTISKLKNELNILDSRNFD
jgi:hypothetical protein